MCHHTSRRCLLLGCSITAVLLVIGVAMLLRGARCGAPMSLRGDASVRYASCRDGAVLVEHRNVTFEIDAAAATAVRNYESLLTSEVRAVIGLRCLRSHDVVRVNTSITSFSLEKRCHATTMYCKFDHFTLPCTVMAVMVS